MSSTGLGNVSNNTFLHAIAVIRLWDSSISAAKLRVGGAAGHGVPERPIESVAERRCARRDLFRGGRVLLADAQLWEVGLEVSVQVVAGLLRRPSASGVSRCCRSADATPGCQQISVAVEALQWQPARKRRRAGWQQETHLFRNMAADQMSGVAVEVVSTL